MDDMEIKDVVKRGRALADRLAKAKFLSDVEVLEHEIESYTDFVNHHFGVKSELDGEKECELTTFLYVALDWKKRSLFDENIGNDSIKQIADDYLSQFEEYLDSKSWAKSTVN